MPSAGHSNAPRVNSFRPIPRPLLIRYQRSHKTAGRVRARHPRNGFSQSNWSMPSSFVPAFNRPAAVVRRCPVRSLQVGYGNVVRNGHDSLGSARPKFPQQQRPTFRVRIGIAGYHPEATGDAGGNGNPSQVFGKAQTHGYQTRGVQDTAPSPDRAGCPTGRRTIPEFRG